MSREQRRRRGALAVLAGAVVAILAATTAPATAAPQPTGGSHQQWLAHRLANSVDPGTVLDTLRKLERYAVTGDGSREAGSEGFDRSLRLFTERLTRAGYRVSTQDVPYRAFAFDAETLVPAAGAPVRILMAHYSVSTPAGGLSAPLVPVDPSGTDPAVGCAAADYPAQVAGTVVLVRTGGCVSVDKAVAATAAGARAIVMYDVTPTAPGSVLRRRATGASIPMAFVSNADADALIDAAGGGALPVTLELRGREFDDVTVNLFAETTGGRADSVVMAGAHLDSGHDGPGINDNGSSAAALLETALRLAPYQGTVRNRVRFAFWGAEELVNLGSTYYVQTLPAQQLARIRLYLNYEMIASSNFVRFVMDGDDSDHPDVGLPAGPVGSGQVEAVVKQAYATLGLPVKTVDLGNVRSDNEPFMAVGVPMGGAHGGSRGVKTADEARVFGGVAGQFYDPCYHQPCDTVSSLHLGALGQVTRAMAWTVGRFAITADDVPGRS
ncbi:M28 family metallopeptidase [Micromonospora polyrhachis]|uniref:N-acetylated-alpha-linked acidic dipeptidase n=1 Tax=Micromonospora polyrhachis TaxID=1282883 RepID=A0A7W7SWQ7_9ACTN|nr:M28 family peptidase [Micromonospora polyrhachis]MBB4962383.1 N-acetylated-alpha-linked acidic dipeptidase [Micromonospora polyrhachis]